MEKIRNEIHTRADFAKKQYYRLIKNYGSQSLAGKSSRKIAQAYRIFLHYQAEFNISLKLINGG